MKNRPVPEDITAFVDNEISDVCKIDEIKEYICSCDENRAEYEMQMAMKLLLHKRFSKYRCSSELKENIKLNIRRNYS